MFNFINFIIEFATIAPQETSFVAFIFKFTYHFPIIIKLINFTTTVLVAMPKVILVYHFIMIVTLIKFFIRD
jgi:hypothetical protein